MELAGEEQHAEAQEQAEAIVYQATATQGDSKSIKKTVNSLRGI